MFTLRPNLASYRRLAWYRFVTGDAPAAIGLMKMAIAPWRAWAGRERRVRIWLPPSAIIKGAIHHPFG
jgi:hypothetical protein